MAENTLLLIKELRQQLRTGKLQQLKEVQARMVVVDPLLRALDWDTRYLEQVKAEYAVGGQGQSVDYALLVSDKPKVFIEVKRPAETDLAKHREQLLDYAFKQSVPLALLTNCVQWWFYLPLLRETNWFDRWSCLIDLEAGEPRKIRDQFVALLAKEEVVTGRAEAHAHDLYKSRKRREAIEAAMPEAWNKMISEQDEDLVELLIKRTRRLCKGLKPGTGVTKDFLSRYENRLRVK